MDPLKRNEEAEEYLREIIAGEGVREKMSPPCFSTSPATEWRLREKMTAPVRGVREKMTAPTEP
jgi:hypothetical protein